MIKNYFKIAWRNLVRDKSYSLINIIGLSLGLSACMLLVLFAWHQLSYDTFHEKSDRIYRMTSVTETANEVIERTYTPVPLVQTLKDELPEVEKATHLSRVNRARIKIEEQTISVEDFYWADQDFFEIFSFSVLRGNKSEFFQNPNSIVITRSVAAAHFRNENPLGKTIQLDDNIFTITGVVDDWPANAHFQPKFIATFSSLSASENESWFNFNTRTYFLLNENASVEEFTDKLQPILENQFGESADEAGFHFTYSPQALTDIFLYSNLEGELGQNGNITAIYVVLSIALLILLNACVNYINLSTARARKRATEVGIRKTFGSGRRNLILQFLGETFLVTGISFLLSLIVIETILPIFNNLFNQGLNSDMLFDPPTIGIFLGIMTITSLLAGLYPAFYLTSFSPGAVLKGQTNFKSGSSFSLGRKGMIVFQFLVSIVLIVSSLVILKQLQFIQQKDLGFDELNLVVIPLGTDEEQKGFGPLKDKLLANPDIQGVTSAVMYPGRGYANAQHWIPGETQGKFTQMGFVNPNFLKVFDGNLIKGRDFYAENAEANGQSVIVNETAVQRLGLGENPIGKRISRTDPNADERPMYEVVGVIEDFNTESLREAIQPLVLYPVNFNVNMIARIAPDKTAETLDFMAEAFKDVNQNASFEYHFVSDFLADFYRSDQNFLEIIISFTVLAVFIAGIGLFGLVGYFIQNRTKELAIRKVLGATAANIISLLSKDFLKLVLLGFVIAIPIAWFAMNQWLADFTYRIEIGPGIFALAGGATLVIALLTVSWQSIKAALANPVDSLRSE